MICKLHKTDKKPYTNRKKYTKKNGETITRTCRKFQEEGKYLGKNHKEMKFKSLQIQQRIPQTKAEDVPQLFEITQPRYWG